jgi:hypothetical protein
MSKKGCAAVIIGNELSLASGNLPQHQSYPLSYDSQRHPSPSLDVENQSQQHV